MRKLYIWWATEALAGTLLAAGIVLLGFKTLEALLLDSLVSPVEGTTTTWIEEFERAQDVIIVGALLLALVWHGLALVDSGRQTDRRFWWGIFFGASILLGSILSWFLLPELRMGAVWGYLCGIFNPAFVYWFGTSGFTPPSHKYAPPASVFMSRWRG
jgi:hypothetical protein